VFWLKRWRTRGSGGQPRCAVCVLIVHSALGAEGPTVRIRFPPARSPLRTLTQHRQSDAEPRYIEAAIGDTVVGCLYLPDGNPAPGPKFDYKPMARRRPAVAARPYTHNGRTLLSTHSIEKRGLAERDLLLHIGGTMDQIGAPARFACCVPADAWNMLGMIPGSSQRRSVRSGSERRLRRPRCDRAA
jgi:hypothetical protein